MAYTVPQLLISQEFSQLATFTQSPLSPLIIGPDLRKGAITAVATGTGGSGYYDPVVTVTDAVSGAGAAITAVMSGGSKGSIHSVTVTAPGSGYGTTPPTVSVSDPTGTGATFSVTLNAGAVDTITVTNGGSGYTNPTLTLSGNATATAVRGDGVITSYTVSNGGAGYNGGATTVVSVTDSNVPTGGSAGTSAVPGTATVTGTYTLRTTLASNIAAVNSLEDITALFGSTIDTNNPLAYALYNAVMNANNTTVYFVAVNTNDSAGYDTALALAEKSNIYYGIVPLSTDSTVMQHVVAHVNNLSVPAKAKWRTCWLSPTYSSVANYVATNQSVGGVATNSNTGPRRVHFVFPDTYYIDETTQVAGYHLAAALAALRAGSVPHQSLTNSQVVGPYYLDKCVSTLTESQLNTLADAGTWIVTQDIKGGIAYTRHQLTADSSNLNYREDSVTANVDSICYGLQARLAPFIGIYNITPGNLLKVRAAIDAELSYRLTNTYTERAGNQLLAYEIKSIAQDALQADKINIVIQLQVPYPMNYITVTLSV